MPPPDTALTTPCVGPTPLRGRDYDLATAARDRANHGICVRRHGALTEWAGDIVEATGGPQ